MTSLDDYVDQIDGRCLYTCDNLDKHSQKSTTLFTALTRNIIMYILRTL